MREVTFSEFSASIACWPPECGRVAFSDRARPQFSAAMAAKKLLPRMLAAAKRGSSLLGLFRAEESKTTFFCKGAAGTQESSLFGVFSLYGCEKAICRMLAAGMRARSLLGPFKDERSEKEFPANGAAGIWGSGLLGVCSSSWLRKSYSFACWPPECGRVAFSDRSGLKSSKRLLPCKGAAGTRGSSYFGVAQALRGRHCCVVNSWLDGVLVVVSYSTLVVFSNCNYYEFVGSLANYFGWRFLSLLHYCSCLKKASHSWMLACEPASSCKFVIWHYCIWPWPHHPGPASLLCEVCVLLCADKTWSITKPSLLTTRH